MFLKYKYTILFILVFILWAWIWFYFNSFIWFDVKPTWIEPLKKISKSTLVSSAIQVPSNYELSTISWSLDIIRLMAIWMKWWILDKDAEKPNYPYFRGLLYDMWPTFPGRDEFVSCIKDTNFSIDQETTQLDVSWKNACWTKIPQDFIFSEKNLDLLERYRLHLIYWSFRKKDPLLCNDLLKIQIRNKNNELVQSNELKYNELKYFVTCNAAAKRMSFAIEAEIYRLESILATKKCELYEENNIRNLCKSYINLK